MKKELEALEKELLVLNSKFSEKFDNNLRTLHSLRVENVKLRIQNLQLLEPAYQKLLLSPLPPIYIKALAPPTQDEVCKALSEYLPHLNEITYNKKTKCFENDGYSDILNNILFDCNYIEDLPPHLITMIGRFYESLES